MMDLFRLVPLSPKITSSIGANVLPGSVYRSLCGYFALLVWLDGAACAFMPDLSLAGSLSPGR